MLLAVVSRDETAGQTPDSTDPQWSETYAGAYLTGLYDGPQTTTAAEAAALAYLVGLADRGADDGQLAATARGLASAFYEQHKREGEV